jgi:hypothetical protein
MIKLYLCALLSLYTPFATAQILSTDHATYNTRVQVRIHPVSSQVTGKKKAFTQSQKDGLKHILDHLGSTADVNQIPDSTVSRLVKSQSIVSESFGAQTYIGVFNISYAIQDVERTLDSLMSQPTPLSVSGKKIYLIVPIHDTELWSETSQWHQTWQTRSISITPHMVAAGTIEDINSLSYEGWEQRTLSQINALARRYHTNHVVFAHLTDDHITITPFDITQQSAQPPLSIDHSGNNYDQAITATLNALKNMSTYKMTYHVGQSAALPMIFKFTHISRWLMVQKTLKTHPLIKSLNLHTLTTNHALFTLTHKAADITALRHALTGQGFNLGALTQDSRSPSLDNPYTLRD